MYIPPKEVLQGEKRKHNEEGRKEDKYVHHQRI
jgi:hypothetical protein